MPTSPFVELGGWRINNWTPNTQETVPEGIPDDGFQQQSTMLIGVESVSGVDSFSLLWLDQSGQPCSASGLQLVPNSQPQELTGENLAVHFGTKVVECDLSLGLTVAESTKTLSGSISKVSEFKRKVKGERFGPDTGSGTFTATANPGT